jgi:hypothetical protein
MQSKCPHCDKAISPGTILCMHCGSYVVQMEERKRRWHLFLIPGLMLAALVGFLLYMNYTEEEVARERQEMLEMDRPVDPAVQRQHQQDEMERRRIMARREHIEAEKQRRLAERQANEKWRATPKREKKKIIDGMLLKLKKRIGGLKESASGDATQEFRGWLVKLEAKVGAIDTFVEAEQYDQARGMVMDAGQGLDEMLGAKTDSSAE